MRARHVVALAIAGVVVAAVVAVDHSVAADLQVKAGDKVVTTEESAVQVGTEVLATVPPNTRLVATDVKDDWVAVVVERGGRKISGWIQTRQLAPVSDSVTARPAGPARETQVGQGSPTYFPLMPPRATGSEHGEEEPTPGLFKKMSLITYDFGASRRNQPYKIFGEDMISIYSVLAKGKGLELTARIPDVDGKLRYRGLLMQMSTLGLGGNVVSSTGANGYVWTARIEKIGALDLSTEGKVTRQPGFDFDSFSKTDGVIQFANGYAVNLFGAIIENRRIVKAGSEKTYLDNSGKRLYGRIISRTEKDGKVIVEETVLK
jgi:hypothetical protein